MPKSTLKWSNFSKARYLARPFSQNKLGTVITTEFWQLLSSQSIGKSFEDYPFRKDFISKKDLYIMKHISVNMTTLLRISQTSFQNTTNWLIWAVFLIAQLVKILYLRLEKKTLKVSNCQSSKDLRSAVYLRSHFLRIATFFLADFSLCNPSIPHWDCIVYFNSFWKKSLKHF